MYKIIGCDKYKGNIIYYYDTDEKCVDFFEVEKTIKPLIKENVGMVYPYVIDKGEPIKRYTLLNSKSNICLLSFCLKTKDFANYCEKYLIICNTEVANELEWYFNKKKVGLARRRLAGTGDDEENEALDFERFITNSYKNKYIIEYIEKGFSNGKMFGQFYAICIRDIIYDIKEYFKYNDFAIPISELSITQEFVNEFLDAREKLDIFGDKIDYKKLLRKPIYTDEGQVVCMLRYLYSMISNAFTDKSYSFSLRMIFMLYDKDNNKLIFVSRGTIEWANGAELTKIEYDLSNGEINKREVTSEGFSRYLESLNVVWLVNFLDSDILNLIKNENIFNVIHDFKEGQLCEY